MSRRLASCAVALGMLALLLALAPAAFASKALVNSFGSELAGKGGGLFNQPLGIAVNQSGAGGVPAGTFYVVDGNNNRVQQFDPAGEFVRTWGWGVSTGTGQFEACTVAANCKNGLAGAGPGQLNKPRGIAVDQANGNLYVTDQNNRRVDVFNATGVFEGAFGWGAATGAAAFEFCTVFSPCRAPNTGSPTDGKAGKFGSTIGYPAVDPTTGALYVADISNRRVDVFSPALSGGIVTGASFVRAFGFDVSTVAGTGFEVCTGADCKAGSGGAGVGQFASTKSPSEVALDGAGNIYVLDAGNKRVEEFDSTPAPVTATFGSAGLTTAFGTGLLQDIAVDPSATPNHLLVAGSNSGAEEKVAVAELDSGGTLIETHGTGLTPTTSSGLAVSKEAIGGNIYLSASRGLFDHFVYVLNVPPTIDPVTTFTGTTANFSGLLVSNGFDVTYHFAYSTDGINWTSFPVPDADAGSAASTIPVSQEVKGLTGSQLYHVRLVAFRPSGGGRATSAETTFTTDPAAPAISESVASQVTETTATLKARLNPQNQATTFHFEYVSDAAFKASGYANATRFPVPDDTLEGGSAAVPIGRDIGGLVPGTTYHFRVVAGNGTGVTEGEEGADRTFTTYPSSPAGLPDDRAYELVSLPDTNGLATTALGLGEGEANGFPTNLATPDGNSVIYLIGGSLPDSEGNGINDQYRAIRTGSGWSNELVSPSGAQSSLPLTGGVSPDHLYALWATGGGASDHGSLAMGTEEGTRYVREPDGTYALIGRGSAGVDPNAKGRWITAGANHLIFTSDVQLEPNAPEAAGPETDPTHFGVRAVGAVYDRTADGTTHVASLLPGDNPVPAGADTFYEGVSADGSSVVFLADPASPGDPASTVMYERRDNATTLEVAGGSPVFAGISRNGDRVFYFRPDGSVNPERGEVFTFDARTETTTPIASEATIVNVSADGSHVYFVSTQQLDDGKGGLGLDNLYVWDGGSPRFIAVLDSLDLLEFGGSSLLNLAMWDETLSPRQNPLNGPQNDPSRTTPDGDVFVFQSHAGLTPYDSEGRSEVYRYDARDESLACVSCNPIDNPPSSNADLVRSIFLDEGSPIGAQALIPNVTDDGETVFFQSGDALVPGDSNGAVDVYEWKAGHLSLISSGHSSAPSYLYGMTPDGHDVFFRTREALVPQDHTAAAGAIYDARIGGGFPAPATSIPCVEDACQGSPSVAPSLPGAGSSQSQASGEVHRRRRPVHCGKKHHRVRVHGHVRCVKNHQRGRGRPGGSR